MNNTQDDTIVVFTARSPQRIIREGGSQAWLLNRTHAKQCEWLVCTQNVHNPDHEFSDATEPHGAAFMVARIRSIERSLEPNEGPQRWMIGISEYALISIPDIWDGGRNPVRYKSMSDLPIDISALKFTPVPETQLTATNASSAGGRMADGLTIAQAKVALAKTFGVQPDAVEITIRG